MSFETDHVVYRAKIEALEGVRDYLLKVQSFDLERGTDMARGLRKAIWVVNRDLKNVRRGAIQDVLAEWGKGLTDDEVRLILDQFPR